MSNVVKKLRKIISIPIQAYRVWKLKRKLNDYPNQLKRIEANDEEEFDNQVMEVFNNED